MTCVVDIIADGRTLLFGEPNICLSELTCISVKFFAVSGMMGKHQ
jgi:hypothetical protein